MRSARAYFALALLLVSGQLSAGTYRSSTQTGVDPFIIIHSPGFTGLNGPVVTVPICLDPSAADLASR